MIQKSYWLGKLRYLVESNVNRKSKLWEILAYTYKLIPIKIRQGASPIDFISSYSKISDDFLFIQIGSNDGISGDPISFYIKRDKWSGILVEPINYLFEKLVSNYEGQEKLLCENVAISEKNEIKNFYRLKESDDLPDWSNQLGSFLLEVVLKHKVVISNIEDYIIVEQVNCMTFEALIQKHKVKKINLLHIDTEGYDYKIIKSIDLSKIKPEMIFYEHKHLNNHDMQECIKYLKGKGYILIQGHTDTLAVLINLYFTLLWTVIFGTTEASIPESPH